MKPATEYECESCGYAVNADADGMPHRHCFCGVELCDECRQCKKCEHEQDIEETMEHFEKHINGIEEILGHPLAEAERRSIGLLLGIVATEAAIEQNLKQLEELAKLDAANQEQQARITGNIMDEILKPQGDK